MAATFNRSPNINTRPVGQPLIYTLTDTSTPDRYVVEVFRSTNRNSIGGSFGKYYLTPRGAIAHYDLSTLAESLLEYPVSKDSVPIHAVQVSDKIFQADELCIGRFTVRPGVYNGTTETMNSGGDATVFCIKGVEQLSAGLDPAFNAYYAASASTKVWLTDREPENNVITYRMKEDEQGVAMFLNNDSLGGAGTNIAWLRVDQYEKSGTLIGQTFIENPTDADPARDYYRAVPVGPGHWSHLGLDPTTVRAEFRFVDSGFQVISMPLNVIEEPGICKHESVQVAWFNTRGGYDYLTFTGRAPQTITTSSKRYRKSPLRYDSATFSIEDGRQDVEFAKTGRKRYTLNEQFFSATDRDLLQYLLRSRVVSIRVGTGDWLPANVLTDSLQIQPSGSQFYAVSLEVEIAQDIRC